MKLFLCILCLYLIPNMGWGQRYVVDSSFNTITSFYAPLTAGSQGYENTIVMLPDSSYLIGNMFTNAFSAGRPAGLFRLRPSGQLDSAFHLNPNASFVYDIKLRGNTIWIACSNYYMDSVWRNCIVKLNLDGTIDTTFKLQGNLQGRAFRLSFIPGDSILAFGDFEFDPLFQKSIIKVSMQDGGYAFLDDRLGFNDSCQSDTCFLRISSCIADSLGNVMVAGYFPNEPHGHKETIIHLLRNGQKDPYFHWSGNTYIPKTLVLRNQDGSFIVSCLSLSDSTEFLAKMRSDGTLDTSFFFHIGRIKYLDPYQYSTYHMHENSDHTYWIYGTTADTLRPKLLMRLYANGAEYPIADFGQGFDGDVWGLFPTEDGKLICMGEFYQYDNQLCHGILRLKPSSISTPIKDASVFVPNVFPNPGNGKGIFDVQGTLSWSVSDLLGRFQNSGDTKSIPEFSITGPPGIYIIHLRQGNHMRVIRYLKQ